MPSRVAMGKLVSAKRVRTECEPGSQDGSQIPQLDLDLSEIAAQRARIRARRSANEDAICSQFFSQAVDAWGKADAYADEIGVTKSIMSEMRSGSRVIKLRDCLPLLDNPESARLFIAALCDRAGLAPPQKRRRVSRQEVESATARRVRHIVELWRLVRPDVAAELGTDVDDVEAAMVEPA
jgi:hypothetical protein